MGRSERRAAERKQRRLNNYSAELRRQYQNKYNEQTQKYIDNLQRTQEQIIIDDWHWFYSLLGLTLSRKYHKNSDYIEKMFTKTNETLEELIAEGKSGLDVIKLLEEETGIILEVKD